MIRSNMVERVRDRATPWDMVIIGGGATGVGVAVDAASRGYDVVLLEQSDFGKGTSYPRRVHARTPLGNLATGPSL